MFAIPSARAVFQTTSSGVQSTVVPGYFKMRSQFVDFTGQYVVRCHILSHEDRGMMTVVEVVPFTTASRTSSGRHRGTDPGSHWVLVVGTAPAPMNCRG